MRTGLPHWAVPFRQFHGHRIVTDIDSNARKALAVSIDPRAARRMGCLAGHIGAVVDAIEIDRLAVIVQRLALGRRLEANHRGRRRPDEKWHDVTPAWRSGRS